MPTDQLYGQALRARLTGILPVCRTHPRLEYLLRKEVIACPDCGRNCITGWAQSWICADCYVTLLAQDHQLCSTVPPQHQPPAAY